MHTIHAHVHTAQHTINEVKLAKLSLDLYFLEKTTLCITFRNLVLFIEKLLTLIIENE